jgi:putative hydroxymethylpyrimidine transporter CytX
MSFGQKGGLMFAFLNVLQLVGWTAIMIYDGALAVGGIFNAGKWVWCLVIGGLIVLWIVVGITNLGWINRVAMAALFLLTLVLCKVIFFSGAPVGGSFDDTMSFGAAVELAVAMPLSWLPLISDYTRQAEKPVQATLASTLTYGLVSVWMYVIGMGAAIYTGESDIAVIMVKAGLGLAALVILVLSTVTTTFLDAWSAGISAESLSAKLNGKWTAVVVTVIGTAAAILFPMDDITDFLYLIGSVFAPMVAIQIVDHFILHRDRFQIDFDMRNLAIWLVGFAAYRWLMGIDTPVGNTLPDMLLTGVLCLLAEKVLLKTKSENQRVLRDT